MISVKKNTPATKRPTVAKKPAPQKPADDLTPPDFLNAKKKFTPEQIAAQKAKADRDDKEQSQIVMPERKPTAARTKAKVEAAQAKGAKTPKQLAADLGTNDRKLRRTLRALAKQGKITHDANGRWLIGPAEVAAIKAAL